MTFRQFSIGLVVLTQGLLLCFLCCFAVAESAQEYRKPSESDLLWLTNISNDAAGSKIVQVSFQSPKKPDQISDFKEPVPLKICSPCVPVNLPKLKPKQDIPPAPELSVKTPKIYGVSREEDSENEAVISIKTVAEEDEAPVLQMSREKLLPPLPPKELPPPETDSEALPQPKILPYQETQPRKNTPFPPETSYDNLFQPKQYNVYTPPEKPSVFAPDAVGSASPLPEQFLYRSSSGSWFSVPNLLLSRPNVTEHFNAETQNRFFADYRHWNNAACLNGNSQAVEQFTFGLEKRLSNYLSVELRCPLFGQYGSEQTAGGANPRYETDLEAGNVSLFIKSVLRRTKRWILTGGIGVSLPTAEDARLDNAALENRLYYLAPFMGVQYRPNRDTFVQFVIQSDTPLSKNKLHFNADSVKVDGQAVLRTGIQLGHWLVRNDDCRLGYFAEINYLTATESSFSHSAGTAANYALLSPVRAGEYTLSGTLGIPVVFGKVTMTNAVILPLTSDGRSFSAGYNFSLTGTF
ncbi:hypothetical protein FACS189419_00760 [Planctomycetales bacterium]|nr:hypothetical protein FACS189419_00760 [Planctomycetales bacterium]